MVMVDAVS